MKKREDGVLACCIFKFERRAKAISLSKVLMEENLSLTKRVLHKKCQLVVTIRNERLFT